MTSAWEWDTTQLVFAQDWPQVNYAVTVTGGETHFNGVEVPKEKVKLAETARWITSHINLKKEDHHISSLLFNLVESGCVSVSGPQRNL